MSPESSEIETCCVLTTEPNDLVRPLHNRMPVIIPNGLEDEWIAPVKDLAELRALEPILSGWISDEWVAESLHSSATYQQIDLF